MTKGTYIYSSPRSFDRGIRLSNHDVNDSYMRQYTHIRPRLGIIPGDDETTLLEIDVDKHLSELWFLQTEPAENVDTSVIEFYNQENALSHSMQQYSRYLVSVHRNDSTTTSYQIAMKHQISHIYKYTNET